MNSTARTNHKRLLRHATIALVALAAVSAMPNAVADHPLDEGCAVTPGGWGAKPAGNNPASALAAHFDELFPDGLTIGGETYDSASEVRAALNGKPADPLLEHAIALALNLAFGAAGHLDGSLEGVEVEGGDFDGWSAEEVLDEADEALQDPDRSTSKYSELIDALSGLNEERFGCNEAPPCPENVMAAAQGDGSIVITWDEVEDADEYRVYRSTNETGPFILLDSTENETFTDDTTAVGQTYYYMVTAVVGEVESEECEVVSATAIPLFGPIAGAVALVGSVAAFAALRRR